MTKMFFSIITMNLKWEFLTNNLVTFKRWDGVKYEEHNLQSQGRGGLGKKEWGDVFEGVDNPMYTINAL